MSKDGSPPDVAAVMKARVALPGDLFPGKHSWREARALGVFTDRLQVRDEVA